VEGSTRNDEQQFELTLRPKWLKDYIGQRKVKENLSIFVKAALARESLLIIRAQRPPGLGKTTLAHVWPTRWVPSSGRQRSGDEKPGDLAAILSNLDEGDVLFIDEIHRLHPSIEEISTRQWRTSSWISSSARAGSALGEDRSSGLHSIGATTRAGMISAPARPLWNQLPSRFLSR
jgi:Holliday junction DNA helicase RuvB